MFARRQQSAEPGDIGQEARRSDRFAVAPGDHAVGARVRNQRKRLHDGGDVRLVLPVPLAARGLGPGGFDRSQEVGVFHIEVHLAPYRILGNEHEEDQWRGEEIGEHGPDR